MFVSKFSIGGPACLLIESRADRVLDFSSCHSPVWFGHRIDDKPDSKIPFDNVILQRTTTSVGRNPYLVSDVDKQLIKDHDDIVDQRVVNLLTHLILLTSKRPHDVRKILEGKKGTAE